jgi:hypothetical protein
MTDQTKVPADELTDQDVCRALGRKTISKLALVLIGDTMYRREADGVWQRVESITDE